MFNLFHRFKKKITASHLTCMYCHQEISSEEYDNHIQTHIELLPDGQQKNHATAPPFERYTNSLEGVPQFYYHAKCKQVTQMPEEIIRSYLARPFMYDESTFCCGCRTYVHTWEMRWLQKYKPLALGERVFIYNQKLKMKWVWNKIVKRVAF